MSKIRVKKNIVERHSPVGREDYLSLQHIDRYIFAKNILSPGMKVLDIACGTGYGTAILVNHGCDVTGGDYSADTISFAKEVWDYEKFVQADALSLQFGDNTFDAVVTFETIEHVYENEAEQYLREMKRVLKPGGLFICSTPNINYTFHPVFHLHEFTADEFFSLISNHFNGHEKYGQYFRMVDRFRDLYLRKLVPSKLNKLINLLENLLSKIISSERAKSIVLGKHVDAIKSNDSPDIGLWLSETMKRNMSSKYGVVDYRGEKMCRIMIVVARND